MAKAKNVLDNRDMKYSNGNTKETGYHSVDSAEDALGDILS